MRTVWIDVAKGLGILLVCMGHTRLGLNGLLASWITSFHMPLFFVMAGLCYDSDRYPSYGRYLIRKVTALGYPYLTLSLFVTVGTYLFAVNFDWISLREGLVGHYIGKCVIGFWFVRALFLVEIAYALIVRLPRNVRTSVIAVIFVIGFFLPSGSELVRLNVVCISLGFYELGYLLQSRKNVSWNFMNFLFAWVIGVFVHVILLMTNGSPITQYNSASFPAGGWFFFSISIIGIFELIFLSRLLERCTFLCCWLSWLGRHSLLLLAFHPMCGMCRAEWIKLWPQITGVPSYLLELSLIGMLLWFFAGPARFFWQWPKNLGTKH